jgi:predicted DNA-binding transcriptional regulator YafY
MLSGPDLARRLEVDVRTVRRYITTLQDLGIPIETTPGRYGGYALRAGFKLPPMMFTDAEAAALALGLHAVRSLALGSVDVSVEGALAKLERVLPKGARERLRALSSTQVAGSAAPPSPASVPAALVAETSLAVHEQRRMRLVYRSEQGSSERCVDPYGIVRYGDAWYLVAFCHLRAAMRNFRLDRVEQASILDETFTRPAAFDSAAFLVRSIADIPDRWDARLVLHTTLEHAQRTLPPGIAVLEAHDGVVHMRSLIDDLDRLARMLVRLACPVTILSPPELRVACRAVAGELLAIAGEGQAG